MCSYGIKNVWSIALVLFLVMFVESLVPTYPRASISGSRYGTSAVMVSKEDHSQLNICLAILNGIAVHISVQTFAIYEILVRCFCSESLTHFHLDRLRVR